ncbi:hypothetical protein [Pedobacter insulae]|uniref:Uncharacterized protein n=1 Tax=Pedobacter insulae TaxID=414048 RepID=A0A1I2WMS2_9SPHI|nr:hypothetical protein [Pedobacter insulae]SFH02029.1 hypothetical protein SAMN04489864_104133 [Pedobacter insulae]
MSPTFTCIYFLENTDTYLLEIKRNDLPQDEDISKIYQWMRVSKDFQEANPLTFRSMDSSMEVEERYFEEGFLKFNRDNGTFIEKYNSAQHKFEAKSNAEIPPALTEAINKFCQKTNL